MHLEDIIDIARQVAATAARHPHSQLGTASRFRLHLSDRGIDLDKDLWWACCAMMRTVIGPEAGDYLFAFPYPSLVAAAMALAGTTDEGATVADAFAKQRHQDYPRGACVPHCPGHCDHFDQIGAAYERTGIGALHLSSVLFWTRRTTAAQSR